MAAGARRLVSIAALGLTLGSGAQSPVELSLPSLIFTASTGYFPVPLSVGNPGSVISGIRFSIRIFDIGLTLDTVLTTQRTAGWRIQRASSGSRGERAFVMFDPTGRNLETGSGPVALLMFRGPADTSFAGYGKLDLKVTTLSDEAGKELPVLTSGATITIGPVASITIGAALGDAGDTVSVDLHIDSPYPVAQASIDILIDPDIISLAGTQAGPGLEVDSVAYSPPSQPDGPATYRLTWVASGAQAADRPTTVSLDWAISTAADEQEVDLLMGDVRLLSRNGRRIAVGSKTAGRITIYPGHLGTPAQVTIDYTSSGGIVIGWDPPGKLSARPELTGFRIYRSSGGEPADGWLNIPRRSGILRYSAIDSSAVSGRRYRYRVAAVYDTGYVSAPTGWIDARFLLPVDVRVVETPWHLGEPLQLPLAMTNDLPISHFSLVLRGLQPLSLARLTATLNRRVPPDWTVALDSLAPGALRVSGRATSKQTLLPGSGRIVTLTQSEPTEHHRVGPVEVTRITLLDEEGEALPAVGIGGVITPWQPPIATFRIGSGQPVAPGSAGELAIYLENDRPVAAMQLTFHLSDNDITLWGATAVGRLPAETVMHLQPLAAQTWRLIVSSPSNEVIVPGNGPVMTIAFRVAASAEPGDRGIEVTGLDVAVAGGVSHRLPGMTGAISVGAIELFVGGAELSVAPSRLVVVPILLAAARPVCSLSLNVGYADDLLELIRVRSSEGWPSALVDYSAAGGVIKLNIMNMSLPGHSGAPESTTGRAVAELIFTQKVVAHRDTTLLLPVSGVTAIDCDGTAIYSQGAPSLVHLTPPRQGPSHFTSPPPGGGQTHFVTIREVTIGGAFLEAGDEIALLRALPGDEELFVAGAGRVEQDGTVTIMARPGMDPDPSRDSRQTGPERMIFQGWSRKTGRESLPSSEAVFVLGRGYWGENKGVTVIDRVPLQDRPRPVVVDLPDEVVLDQNMPNPFRDSTTVRFGLPAETEVHLGVYNLLGRQVAALHDGLTGPGYHLVVWDGRNDARQKVASGLLFLQLRAAGHTLTRKMILMP